MSKALQGLAELGGAIAMGVGAFFDPALLANPFYLKAMEGLVLAGVASEAGAIAQAIGSNAGMGVTTRQPAAARQIIRGVQRVGGTIVYCSTTGSSKRQYNLVIVLATHPCEAIENLYLDGRQVFWDGSPYNQTVNGYNFGGDADSNTHIGPNGVHYNFGGLVFCAAFQGKQTSAPTVVGGSWVGPSTITDATASYPGFCSALQANDSTWSPATQPGPGAASATAQLGPGGSIAAISVNDSGFNYADSTDVQVTILDLGGPGQGATAHGIALGGRITSIVVDAGGFNYVQPQVTIAPPSSSTVTPYLAGCTYVYLKLEADAGQFPQFPEIKFTVHGKNDVWDPRTSTRGYTANWALQVADMISDPTWGLGDASVNQAQLIAAANVCDELVGCAAGDEARWTLHCHYDTATAPGDAIERAMNVAAGRLSRIGGEWFIWPAYWQGPSASFNEGALIDPFSWSPRRQPGELINRVTGKYTAPNLPYNVAGNLYDSNGYFQGQTQNNFPFGFQPTDFPQYAADALHGYGEDVYLIADTPNLGAWSNTTAYAAGQTVIYNSALWTANEAVPAGSAPGALDGGGNPYWSAAGIYLPRDVDMTWCLSVSQAQRAAKVLMLRNRQQGSGTLTMNLSGYQLQPTDVIEFSSTAFGWSNKQLEVAADNDWAMRLELRRMEEKDGGEGALALVTAIRVVETDQSVYEWADTEELTPYDVPVITGGVEAYDVAAPANVTITDDAATAQVLPDGTSLARALVTWNEAADTYVTSGGGVEVQYAFWNPHTATWPPNPGGPPRANPLVQLTLGGTLFDQSAMVDLGRLSGQATYCYIPIVDGFEYLTVQVRFVRSNGATSAWTQDTGTVGAAPPAISKPVPLFPIGGAGAPVFKFTDSGTTLDLLEPAESGANATARHVLTAMAGPITTNYYVFDNSWNPAGSLGFNVTAASASDVFTLSATLLVQMGNISGWGSNTLKVGVRVDSGSSPASGTEIDFFLVLAQTATGPNQTQIAYVASLSGLTAGAHTLYLIFEDDPSSTTSLEIMAGSSVTCQRVF